MGRGRHGKKTTVGVFKVSSGKNEQGEPAGWVEIPRVGRCSKNQGKPANRAVAMSNKNGFHMCLDYLAI